MSFPSYRGRRDVCLSLYLQDAHLETVAMLIKQQFSHLSEIVPQLPIIVLRFIIFHLVSGPALSDDSRS